jgi:hypothetical protein
MQKLSQTVNTDTLAEIVCCSESTHYLIRQANVGGIRSVLTNRKGKMQTFKSQRDAQLWLRNKGHSYAVLCIESAYDEFATMTSEADAMVVPLH